MTDATKNRLNIVLISDDACRVALLRDDMQKAGLDCTLRRIAPTRSACACLARRKPFSQSAVPDLALLDLAACTADVSGLIKAVAFGRQRSKTTLVMLVDSTSEALLASGELDGGRATMFSPQSLQTFLGKLAGPQQNAFLRAMSTLYEYGPILVKEPRYFRERLAERLSA